MRFRANETACRSCGELYPASDLDRYLWCRDCRRAIHRRGAFWGRVVGVLTSAGVACYLFLWVHPSPRFLAFYLLMLALTYVLTSRIAVAVVHGYCRARGSAPGGVAENDSAQGEPRSTAV